MSLARGGGNPRGRGRGSTQLAARGRGRGTSTPRGRVFNNATAQRGASTMRARASFGQFERGATGQAGRGQHGMRGNASAPSSTTRASFDGANTGGSWQERYQKLNKSRDRERADAIRQGLVADPEKPRALSEAITPVGTCQDLCAEFERVQRVVQDDVWTEEKGADGEPDELRMVKKFRRAAAGLDEQLPSDLRSPPVLKRTCDYLFDEVIGNAPTLAQIHHFVWDRTRAIRNDFSIQQLTKLDELRIAVDCYERIARFHILSLHQLASPEKPYPKYDWQQEREQLDRTLLSLTQYYDDTRGRIDFPNEAEFRAYCIIFQFRSPTPDLEDSVQAWPKSILRDKRVRRALDVYAAGCTVMGIQGPLNPKSSHLIARQDWQRVWVLLASNEVSYLMGCVAEVFFNAIRRMVLNALFRTFRPNATLPTPDLTLDVLCELFSFDEEEEVHSFCQYFGFSFKTREDGHEYLDLSSIAGRVLPQPNAEMPNQLKSSLVENKRLGRTLPAVINGLTVQQAQDAGLVVEEEHDEGMDDVEEYAGADMAAEEDEDSLFIPESTKPETMEENGAQKPSLFSWGKPSGAAPWPFSAPAPVAQPVDGAGKPTFDFLSGGAKNEGNAASKPSLNFLNGGANTDASKTSNKPSFDFLGAAAKPAEKPTAGGSGFYFLQPGHETSNGAGGSKSIFSLPGSTAGPRGNTATAPKFDFTGGAGVGGLSSGSQETSRTKDSDQEPTADTQQKATAPKQDGIFAKARQQQASALPAFQFATPAPDKPTSPERTIAQRSPGVASPTANLTRPPTADSASSPADSANLFLQPLPKSPAPTSYETATSFSAQARQAQPHFTAPSANAPPSLQSPPPSPSNLNTALRRPSTSTDTRPKKPSPLSHSFTAADDSSARAREPPSAFPAAKPAEQPHAKGASRPPQPQPSAPQQVSAVAPAEDEYLKKPVPFERPRRPSEEAIETFDATVTRIAKELVEDPVSGYLKQYVEYTASQIITSVQAQIAAEKMKLRLSELRVSTLYRKYVKRWIDLIWQRRLAKSGKDRRQRRRKRLEEGFDDGSSRADGSVGGSGAESVVGTSSWKDHQENVDAMFQRTMNSTSLARPMPGDQQARAGSKRPSSSHGENGLSLRASAHKRLKSTSHVDDRGRVTKPTPTSHPNDEVLKRSSFLGFSVNGPSPPNKNTTKSNYFRLKAMGVHRADELSASRATKRPRTELSQPAQTSPPQLRKYITAITSPDDSTGRSLMAPPSSTLSRAQKAKEEDDALLARIRAARESLTVGTAYMRFEMEVDEVHRRSLSASRSSTDSPSLLKARAEARARVSRSGSPDRDVPAYRLRESKFVPREQYGRAIERANEMRESRSRDVSRPASRLASSMDQAPANPSSQPHALSITSTNDGNAQRGLSNGGSQPQPPFKWTDPYEVPQLEWRDSNHALPWYSPLERPEQESFADQTTDESTSNPFLHSTVPDSGQPDYNQHSPFDGLQSRLPTFGSQTGFGTMSAPGTTSAFGSLNAFSLGPPTSAFGSLSAGNNNPFGSAFASTSKPTLGSTMVSREGRSFAAPQDQTVHPELIDQSLANSFGSRQAEPSHDAAQPSQHSPVPAQQNSHMSAQTISLLSDDEEDQSSSPAAQYDQPEKHVNGLSGANGDEDDEELLDEATDEEAFQAPYGHANPFSILAEQDSPDKSQSQSQATGDEIYDQDQFDQDEEQLGDGFESPEDFANENGDVSFDDQYYGGEEDEEGANGDIEDASDVDEDGESEDGFASDDDAEEDEGEGDEETVQPPQPWQKVEYADPWHAKPAPNPALQGMGKTEDAPIELDSD